MSEGKQFAVLGNPVEHSLSPVIHQHFAAQFGYDITYARQLLQRDTFEPFVRKFFAAGGVGLNVTLPFKLQANECARWHDVSAHQAAAANTLAMTDQGIGAWNTDGAGLVNDLRHRHGFEPGGKKILILGAGGATQGILGPILACRPASLALANRTLTKAQNLARDAQHRHPQCHISAFSLTELNERSGDFDLVINSTSLGLHDGRIMLPAEVVRNAFCYDLSYGASARFARWARDAGASSVADGLGMLVEQAALSFAIWLGDKPQTQQVYQLLVERTQHDG